jgi:hypothetical protein
MSYPLSAGTHTLEWRYEKDDSIGDLKDRAWVDAVTLPPTTQELAVAGPSGGVLASGKETVRFPTTVIRTTSDPQIITIRNIGKADLTGLNVTAHGENPSEFSIGKLSKEALAPGGSMSFKVVFAPKASGLRTASLRIHSNDSANPRFVIHLEGNARGLPLIQVSQPVATKLKDGASLRKFGTAEVGSVGMTRTFTISNRGSAALNQLEITKSGPHRKDFIIEGPKTTSLAPGESTKFKVTFSPTERKLRKISIHISSNDRDSGVFDIALEGTGIPRQKSATGPTLASSPDSGGIVGAVFGGGSLTTALAQPPVPSIEVIEGRKYRALTLSKAPGMAVGTVEVSSNLLDWFSGKKHTTTVVDDAATLKVRDNTPIAPDANRYIRVK